MQCLVVSQSRSEIRHGFRPIIRESKETVRVKTVHAVAVLNMVAKVTVVAMVTIVACLTSCWTGK